MAVPAERQALLGHKRPVLQQQCSQDAPNLDSLDVYNSIHRVFRDIKDYLDVPLTDDQFRSPEIQFAIVQPLEAQYAELQDPSIVYVLLLVRLQFLRERDSALASSSLNDSRANLCEILAIKLLRHQATTAKGPNGALLGMARSLVGGFKAFQGATDEVLERIKQKEGYASRRMEEGAGKTNALELAILGKARYFIKSQATQRVITAIWEGKIVYTSSSFINILPDRWKIHQISVYNVKQAPLLDHYRLRVPKYRSIIENCSFLVLFVSFVWVISEFHRRDEDMPVASLSGPEYFFWIYCLGYTLDRLGSIAEHGWSVYSAGLTNGLDMLSVPIFLLAFVFRTHSVATNEEWAHNTAYAILSCAACFMFPRLAFAAISNNLLILSLRAMLAEFAYLMGIAVFCTLGFVFALNHLCDGAYSVSRISEWLIFIWFGLDGSGLDKSPKFHPYLGPVIFTVYAALTNTLLVSLLVAILSTTYSAIATDAAAEDMFRKAVMTFEGVKSDSLFDYVPPLNLLALCVMWPVSKLASPRWFHKINVATTRVFSLPILLLIALYERQSSINSPLRASLSKIWIRLARAMPSAWTHRLSLLEGAHWECEAVFEYTPSGDEKDSSDEEDMVEDTVEAAINDPECQRRVSSRASKIIETSGRPLSPAPPTLSARNSSYGLASPQLSAVASAAASTSASPQPTPMSRSPTRPAVRFDDSDRPLSESPPNGAASLGPRRRATERLPTNAGYGAAGSSSHGPSPSSTSAVSSAHKRARSTEDKLFGDTSALSTSPAHGSSRFESPLAKLYHFHTGSGSPDDGVAGMAGLKRRLSVGRSATIAVPPVHQSSVGPSSATHAAHRDEGQSEQLKALLSLVKDLQDNLKRVESKLDRERGAA